MTTQGQSSITLKKAYLKYYSHLILMTKHDSQVPEIYGGVSIFILSFHNIVNLITVSQVILLNKSFFTGNLPEEVVTFFKNYHTWILLLFASLFILNNILLHKQAKDLGTKYDKLKSSIYVFSYFIFTWFTWLLVVTYDTR